MVEGPVSAVTSWLMHSKWLERVRSVAESSLQSHFTELDNVPPVFERMAVP